MNSLHFVILRRLAPVAGERAPSVAVMVAVVFVRIALVFPAMDRCLLIAACQLNEMSSPIEADSFRRY